MPFCVAIIALTPCVSGCAGISPKIDYPPPPVPDSRVLEEMDAHGMTKDSAPYTWAFLGKVFMYYDMVK